VGSNGKPSAASIRKCSSTSKLSIVRTWVTRRELSLQLTSVRVIRVEVPLLGERVGGGEHLGAGSNLKTGTSHEGGECGPCHSGKQGSGSGGRHSHVRGRWATEHD